MKSIQVTAHRGFSGLYPENTAIAFAEALNLEVDMIEFDVHLSKDEALIICHDATVDRTSNGTGAIENMTLSEIKRLDAGSWMDYRFKETRFLTLEETLEQIGGKARLNIHIKANDQDRETVTPLVVRQIEQYKIETQCFIASDEATLRLVKEVGPDISICNLSTQPKETYIERSLLIGCTLLQPGNAMVDESFVQRAHGNHMVVNPFYADDPEEMRRLIGCDVDGILTNYPDRLYTVLMEMDK
jgi:glycerophosphoryl diester phosphodiesterase